MVSPELLRRFPFFGFLTPDQLDQIAMAADTVLVNRGDCLFETGQPADGFYLLISGAFELSTESYDQYYKPELRRNYLVGEVNPGEVFGLSALIEPHTLTASALATADSEVLRIDSARLRELAEADSAFAAGLYEQIAQALMERLNYTRVQLAAARH